MLKENISKGLAADSYLKEGEYWINKLTGFCQKAVFPPDIKDKEYEYKMERISFSVPEKLSARLITIMNGSDPRLHMILVAGVMILFRKYSGKSDLTIGSPIYKQEIDGDFINTTLVLRIKLYEEMTFRDLLLEVRKTISEAVDNQNYPIESLIYKMGMSNNSNDFPLFDVAILLENIQEERFVKETAPNILFSFFREGEEIKGTLKFNVFLYQDLFVKQVIRHFHQVLQSVLFNVEMRLSEVDILDNVEKKQLIEDFNQTKVDYPLHRTIHELFVDQSRKFPNKTALIYLNQHLSYQDLNQRADFLAFRLAQVGVIRETLVPILVERSLEMFIGMLSVLKAGGAYLPIDPDYPALRNTVILEDSKSSVILIGESLINSHRGIFQHLSLIEVAFSKEDPIKDKCEINDNHQHYSSQLAYVLYTSGTTGKPKGVMVEHKNVVNLVFGLKERIYKNHSEYLQVCLLSPVVFDASVKQIYSALLLGYNLNIVPEKIRVDGASLLEYYRKYCIDISDGTPSHLRLFLAAQGEKSFNIPVKHFIIGGESLGKKLVKTFLNRFANQIPKITNVYGPAECTVDATSFEVTFENINQWQGIDVPIGKPLPNYQIYILDKGLRLLPIWVSGEICVGGVGISRGYLGREDDSTGKFINHPFMTAERMYRTGDYGRWLNNGILEFIGREDHQVKIRGFRIELGEIENTLKTKTGIKDAVVTLNMRNDTQHYMCGYIISQTNLKLSELREWLLLRLPEYMVPSYFVILDEFPLTSSGKVDRHALPEPAGISLESDIFYEAPRNEIEMRLQEVWQAVLGIEKIGIQDNFFMMGGDSIKSIQISARMHQLGYKIGVRDIFMNPCIAQLALQVEILKSFASQSVISGEIPLTPIQHKFFTVNGKELQHFNQAVMLHSEEGLSEEILRIIFSKIQAHHDVLRMTYQRKKNEILQVNHQLEYPLSIHTYNFSEYENADQMIEEKANYWQTQINLEEGPLMKLALFHTGKSDYLLIILHHLVVDGVSWRILFEDITTLYRQYKKGKEFKLPPKTDSFKLWAERLTEYANSHSLLVEQQYWNKNLVGNITPLFTEYSEGSNFMSDVNTCSFQLTEGDTSLLLTRVNGAFGTEINDILLTSLGMAIKQKFNISKVLIALEGHGREEIFTDVDISRTLGWFTTVYPVLLNMEFDENLARQIKEIKENLHKVPNNGIGYGILKYLTAEKNKNGFPQMVTPEIGFNYLGQFDTDVQNMSFGITRRLIGNSISLTRKREYKLDVSAAVSNNQLMVSIIYSQKQYSEDYIITLLEHYKNSLEEIISFCSLQKKSWLTPSDLTFKELTIDVVDQLQENYDMEDVYPLAPLQEGILFHSLYDRSSSAYFGQFSFSVSGQLDISIMKQSLNELLKRYDVLRSIFLHQGFERPLQLVFREREAEFYFEDIGGKKGEDLESFLENYKKKDRERSFQLDRDALIRLAIFKIGETKSQLILSHHHILVDGWCIRIVIADFIEIYNCLMKNIPLQLAPVKPYKIYIQWLEEQNKESARKYWKNYLEGYDQLAKIPQYNYPGKKKNKEYRNDAYFFDLDNEETRKVKEVAGRNNVTLNILSQAVWGILLGLYNDRNDVAFGVVVSGRPSEINGIESMVGLFINTVPVRIQFNKEENFHQYLQRVQKVALESEKYHYFSLADIQAGSALKSNLLDHIFVFENYPIKPSQRNEENITGDQKLMSLELSNTDSYEQSNYDFNVVVVEANNQIYFQFKYNGYLYERDSIEAIANHFKSLLLQVLENENVPIEQLEMISSDEKKRILSEFNYTECGHIPGGTIQELYMKQASERPDHLAIVLDSGCLTYKKLNERTDFMAAFLMESGVKPESVVGIITDPSIKIVEGILGILKAGGAYLPVDPELPASRKVSILKDCNTSLLLTIHPGGQTQSRLIPGKNSIENRGSLLGDQENLDFNIKTLTLVDIDYDTYHLKKSTINRPTQSGDLAYLMPTSGSTGVPKCVMVEHRNVIRLVKDTNYLKFNIETRILQTGKLDFDASTFEIWGSLLNGGTLFPSNKQRILSPGDLKNQIENNKINTLWMTSSLFNLMVDQDIHIFKDLKNLMVGGDVLSPAHINCVRNYYPGILLINGYGPTENTTFSTYFPILRNYEGRIPIGKPIKHSSVYIVNFNSKLQPIGIVGEILVGGSGIARGYLNRPELTAEKFLFNQKLLWGPRGTGNRFRVHVSGACRRQKIYRTGDLGLWLPDGNIEFIGRKDFQVKVRGIRIEPAEIESCLVKHEKVKQVVVLVHREESGDKCLTAYVVCKTEVTSENLKCFLNKHLPEYMVPSYFVFIDTIPMTPNGKIDRKAMPNPLYYVSNQQKTNRPTNEIERNLQVIWSNVLGIEKESIGVDASFFDLGGHSLKATVLASMIHKKMDVKYPLREIFTRPTIREMSEFILSSVKNKYISLQPVEKREYYPLSSAQKRIYFLHNFTKTSSENERMTGITHYNIYFQLSLGKSIDKERVEATFKKLIHKHESLRTSFLEINEMPAQRIIEMSKHSNDWDVKFSIDYIDMGSKEWQKMEKGEAEKNFLSTFIRPFDLSMAPLIRAGLIKHCNGYHTLFVDIHHIVSDGTSHLILIKDFNYFYKGGEVGTLRLQYKDYSQWQNSLINSGEISQQENYWLELYADAEMIPRLEMLTDFKRPKKFSFKGDRYQFQLKREEAQPFFLLAAESNGTLYMNILAALNALFYKYTGLTDIVVGSVIAGRPHADLLNITGMFVNTLAMRNTPYGDKTYRLFLQEVIASCLSAFENQDVQFETLVDRLALQRDTSRNPLFDVVMVVQNLNGTRKLSNSNNDFVHYKNPTAKFDITFFIYENGEDIHVSIEYYTGIFKKETIQALAMHFEKVISIVARKPWIRLKEIELISIEEKRQVLYMINEKSKEFSLDITLDEIFTDRVMKSGDRIALVGNSQVPNSQDLSTHYQLISLSYTEFDKKARQLSHYLHLSGISANRIIGILQEPSVEMLVAIFGILKAGCAYLPIGLDMPEKRIKYMLEDCNVSYLLSTKELLKKHPYNLNENFSGEILLQNSGDQPINWFMEKSGEKGSMIKKNGTDIAYIIYTSGSTGKPKGVLINHFNVKRVVLDTNYIQVSENDRVLQLSNYAFDGSVFDIYGALLNGGTLVFMHGAHAAMVDQVAETIYREKITVFFVTTALFNMLVDQEPFIFSQIRKVLFGGERISVDHTRRALEMTDPGKIVHVYGPTETTVYATYYDINEINEVGGTIPIGIPISYTYAYVLDRDLKLASFGIIGELFIGGYGTARGYLNRQELTHDGFINNPYIKGDRLYRTGDLVFQCPDGNIVFWGRVDNQVKIRGYRIELEEIEKCLLAHPHIKEVVVLTRREGNIEDGSGYYICAYFVGCKDSSFGNSFYSSELKHFLRKELPDFMIPNYFIPLEKLPLNANGKVDQRALELIMASLKTGVEYVKPESDIERLLADIWKEILNIDDVGVKDNFFDVGGNSLRVVQLKKQINEKLGVEIPIAALFEFPTIQSFIEFFDQKEKGEREADEVKDRSSELDEGKARKLRRIQSRKNKPGAGNQDG